MVSDDRTRGALSADLRVLVRELGEQLASRPEVALPEQHGERRDSLQLG